MDNINREITLLREIQINWAKEIKNLDIKIKDLIDYLDLAQEIRNEMKLQNRNKIKNDEERNVREWNKHLDFLMNIYNKEQNDDNVDNLLKRVGQKPKKKRNYSFKKLSTPLSTTTQKISPKVISLCNIFLTKHEIEILNLEFSFTLTPENNISELQTNIYLFIRKLRLTYHFRDSTYEDKSIVKNKSTFTPKNNENQDLEGICKNLSEIKINTKRISDNIPNLRDGLHSLMTKIRSNKIIINPADKGSIVAVMSGEYYWTIC